ncbi:MAG TPA: HD domain-containing phosphohydrolase [Abditibacteriaceae bacterium]|jgi:putative two-component system response regulator
MFQMPTVQHSHAQLLIVDDEPSNVLLLEDILQEAGYTSVTSTTDSRQVAQLCENVSPDIILLDLMMPHLDGFEILRQLQNGSSAEPFLPVLVLTADVAPQTKRRALAAGAHDFLTKPFDETEVLLRINNLLSLHFAHGQLRTQNLSLEERVSQRTQELEVAKTALEESRIEVIDRLARAGEFRDDDTGQHTRRVSHTSALVATAMGLPVGEVELIRRAAPLHDVGKIGIPDSILLKPHGLTKDEFDAMKQHTTLGAAILSGGHSEFVQAAERIALSHHERWNGTGYPQGLAGEDIPLEGRILAIADVFDALTHERPYKKAWSVEDAIAEIQRQCGEQFDPRVVNAFLTLDHKTLL